MLKDLQVVLSDAKALPIPPPDFARTVHELQQLHDADAPRVCPPPNEISFQSFPISFQTVLRTPLSWLRGVSGISVDPAADDWPG